MYSWLKGTPKRDRGYVWMLLNGRKTRAAKLTVFCVIEWRELIIIKGEMRIGNKVDMSNITHWLPLLEYEEPFTFHLKLI